MHQNLGRAAFGQAENLGDINDNKTQWRGWTTKERVGEPFSLLINVTFTISFVSFHITFFLSSHSTLSFRSSIVRTYDVPFA